MIAKVVVNQKIVFINIFHCTGLFLYIHFLYVMLCSIWHHLYNLRNVENTYEGVLPKVTLLHRCFSRFFKCTNGTKSRNESIFSKVHLRAFQKMFSMCFNWALHSFLQATLLKATPDWNWQKINQKLINTLRLKFIHILHYVIIQK